MENRKVINATPTEFDNIKFKSKLEAKLYKVLTDEGFNPVYEPFKFHVWKGFKPSAPFYERDKKTRLIKRNDTKIIDITYSPDLVFDYNGHRVFVEVKPDAFTNDVYPYKQKLFRKYMESNLSDLNPIFVKVGTIRNLRQFIRILKEEYGEDKES